MRLLDRYISREVASHSLLGLAVFTFVFFVPSLVQLMDLIVRHSGGPGTIILLFLCTLPAALVFTIPMAVLVGVLIGLGRLSADSEIVAIHACGISLRRLLLPIGVVAGACTAATLAMTLWLSPASLRIFARLEGQILSSQAPSSIQPRVFDERLPHYILYVQDVEATATQWRGVFLAATGNDGPSAVTTASGALVVTGRNDNQIDLHLGAGALHEYDPKQPARYNVTRFGESDIPVDISRAVTAVVNPSLSVRQQSTSSLLFDNGPSWRQSRVELQNRLAFPAACLVFALLGIPMGVRPRRGGRAAGLILALVLIGGYYFLFVWGAHTAIQGRTAPWLGIWLANMVGFIGGLLLLTRIESVRRPNPLLARLESAWHSLRNGSTEKAVTNGASAGGNGSYKASQPALDFRRIVRRAPLAFPNLVDIYLLQ